MKSYVVHYQNKYPGGLVLSSEHSIDVYSDGHRVALRKNGAGQWVDQSEEMGCVDRHCLAPIPRDARVMKLHKDGRIVKDDQAEARKPVRQELADHEVGGDGKVPSIYELHKAANGGAEVDGARMDPGFSYKGSEIEKKLAPKGQA